MTEDPYSDLVAELEHFAHCISAAGALPLAGLMLSDGLDPHVRASYLELIVGPRRERLRRIFAAGRAAGDLTADADVEIAAIFLTGSWYSFHVAGRATPRTGRAGSLTWCGCHAPSADSRDDERLLMSVSPSPPRSAPWSRGLRVSFRPARGDAGRVTTFELFFDLVYVFAFTQVSAFMVEGHNAQALLQGLVVLGLLWWTWVGFAWVANRAPADQPVMIVGMSVAMAAVFVIALAIPESFAAAEGAPTAALVLALAYTVVRLVHVALYALSAGEDVALRRQIIVFLGGAMIPSVAALVIGAVIGGQAQLWIWLGALAYDLLVTRLSSRSGGGWGLHSPSHWAERHGLVVILALGESIVAIGVAVAREPISASVIIGAVLALLLSILLWWTYFTRFAPWGESELERRSEGRQVVMARDVYSYGHAAIVAGVIIAALGIEEAMAHVADSEPFGWFGAIALMAGAACVIATIAISAWVSATPRAGAVAIPAVVMVVLIPLAQAVAPLPALAIAASALAVTAAIVALVQRTQAPQQRD